MDQGNVRSIMRRDRGESGRLAGPSPRYSQQLTGRRKPIDRIVAGESDDIIKPPESMTVPAEPRTVLYGADGHALIRRIGYQSNPHNS